ncbi:MAG: hypothetical protein K8L97_31120 [Anaerolineae bacterium]|nr:hypothetical protein [Anaerolineae bacterium]
MERHKPAHQSISPSQTPIEALPSTDYQQPETPHFPIANNTVIDKGGELPQAGIIFANPEQSVTNPSIQAEPIPAIPPLPRAYPDFTPYRQRYDDQITRLRQLYRLLQRTAVPKDDSYPLPPLPLTVEQPPTTYPTGMGDLTFTQLYEQTRRVVGSILYTRHEMLNPEDIDDCLQSAYSKIWQKLEANPAWFAGKPKRYIVQAVVFRSKAQRFSHQRHYRKLVYDAQPNQDTSHLTTNRVDTWIDLEQALGQVARHVEQKPPLLLGLYCLITDVRQQDVAATFKYGFSTLTSYRRQIRATLTVLLDGYGKVRDSTHALVLPQPSFTTTASTARITTPHEGLVVSRLLQTIDEPVSQRTAHPSPAAIPASQPDETQQRRAHIRAQIRPFQPPAPPPTFPTRWAGTLPLAAILDDPVVQRAAHAKARNLGLSDADSQDCIQRGSIRLWTTLLKSPDLLADKGPLWTGIYLAYSGNSRRFHRLYRQEQHFDRPDWDWAVADEYLPLAARSEHDPFRWLDEAIDLEQLMGQLAQQYAHEPRKLFALYALTTSTSVKAIAPIVGLHEKNFAATVGNTVKADLQTLLGKPTTNQYLDWETQLKNGQGLEHVAEVAQQVLHDQRLLLALYVVTTSVTRKAVAETFHLGMTQFAETIRQIKELLAAAYRTNRHAAPKG